jgi:signal transduction histidine kinase
VSYSKADKAGHMQDKLQHTNTKYQLLTAIYEKITATMTLQEIFEVVLSELVTEIDGKSAVIQIINSENRKRYYGYHKEEGNTFWEPNEYNPCLEYMLQSIDMVAQEVPEKNDNALIRFSNSVYAQFGPGSQPNGYIVIAFNKEEPHTFSDEIQDIIVAVVGQINILLTHKRVVDETIQSEKISLIDKILSTLIHDMKNPLSGISGFVQLIEQKSDDESINKYCNTILDSLAHLAKINDELYTIVSGSPLKMNTEVLSLPIFIKEVVGDLLETYTHAGIDIAIEPGENTWIVADREKLRKVFRNILINAKEAMPEGGNIRIKAYRIDDRITIEIGDTGSGMPVHVQENVFKPFVSFGKEQTTGLGMTIAQKIIQEHKGTVSVASFLGIGTVFTINLPCTEKEATR